MDDKSTRVSQNLYIQEVDPANDISVGWNRFYPTIFVLNGVALELLEGVKDRGKTPLDEETGAFFEELLKYKFIYHTEKDNSKKEFFQMIDRQLAGIEEKGRRFYGGENAYDDLGIFTDECNLTCPYCVNRYRRRHLPVHKNSPERLEIIRRCLDQYVSRRLAKASEPVKIFFNGGEILWEWETIKAAVSRLSHQYKGVTFNFGMNTNLTLMTEEIAEFLSQHNFEVNISIDGYRDAHDRTRKYPDGRGSFDDVIKGLEIYREFFKKSPINVFQGTFDRTEDFLPEKVYEMEKYGFLSARLAPNLLDVSEEEALKKAEAMGRFLQLNTRRRFQVTELFFANAKERINREEYRFSFNCRGLSCLPTAALYLNISTLRVSRLCAYVPSAYLPLDELGYDIYHPQIWEASYRFIEQRVESLKKYCSDCHLVGLCSGGCIYTGLDNENRVNRAACAFQKKLWHIYIDKIYRDRKGKK